MSIESRLEKIKDERLGSQLTGEKTTSIAMGSSSEADAQKLEEIRKHYGIEATLSVAKGAFYNQLSVGRFNTNEKADKMAKNLMNTKDEELKNNIQRGVNNMMSNFSKGTQNG